MLMMKYLSRCISGVALAALLLATSVAVAAPTVRFSTPPWPGVEVETEVVSQVFQALGYDTEVISSAPTLGIKSVSSGDVDAVLAVWIPSQQSTLESVMAEGNVAISGTVLDDALYGIVVPDYVWDAGVHSIADLHEYPDKFERAIYGIDAGSDGNLIVKNAIDNNTYDLQGWQLKPSTTAAMLAQAKRRIERDECVPFLVWKPHWMNIELKLKYLDDPEGIWGGEYLIHTIANKDFLQENAPIKRFLKQFKVTAKTQSEWIYQYSFKNIAKEQVARAWLDQNRDVVDGWLQGVEAVDGQPAAEAFE